MSRKEPAQYVQNSVTSTIFKIVWNDDAVSPSGQDGEIHAAAVIDGYRDLFRAVGCDDVFQVRQDHSCAMTIDQPCHPVAAMPRAMPAGDIEHYRAGRANLPERNCPRSCTLLSFPGFPLFHRAHASQHRRTKGENARTRRESSCRTRSAPTTLARGTAAFL